MVYLRNAFFFGRGGGAVVDRCTEIAFSYTGLTSRKALDSVFLGYISISYSVDHFIHFLRNAFSRKSRAKQRCECTGLATSASMAATRAAGDGISPSTVQSARLRQSLTVWYTWSMEIKVAPRRTCTARVTLKESARNCARARCAWDSGSVIAIVTDLLTRTRAGTRCPGYTWKKYLPHRLKKRVFSSKFLKIKEGQLLRVVFDKIIAKCQR